MAEVDVDNSMKRQNGEYQTLNLRNATVRRMCQRIKIVHYIQQRRSARARELGSCHTQHVILAKECIHAHVLRAR